MSAQEDIVKLTQRMQLINKTPYSTDMERYTRAAMVALLRLIRSRTIVDWETTMELFLEKVERDKSLLIGSNSLQELFMHLHCFGVWTTKLLENGPRQLSAIPGLAIRSQASDHGLLTEDTLPAVVHMNFVVPRKALTVFTSRSADEIQTPALHIAVCQTASGFAYEKYFLLFSFQFRSTSPRHQR